MSDSAPNVIRPLGVQMYVEKIRPLKSHGGIHLPESFDYRFSAKKKFDAIPDFFIAKILAIGPDERSGLQVGDHTLVWTYAEGDGSKLFSGESVGEKNRLFIKGTPGGHQEKCDHLNVLVEL